MGTPIGELTNLRDLLPQTDDRRMCRGEVWYVDLEGVEYCSQYVKRKSRPALIIQNDLGNQKANTVVIALISHQYKPYPFFYKTWINGEEGVIQFNQIMTVDKFRILDKIDELSEAQMEKADKALMNSLALNRFSYDNVLGFTVESKITKQTETESIVFFIFRFELEGGENVKMRVPLEALTSFDPAITERNGPEAVRRLVNNCVGLHWVVTHKEYIEI